MFRWSGQAWIARLMRSRGLTLSVAFALFMGWISLVGFLLWQVKVKEEFPCLASLRVHPDPGGLGEAGPQQIQMRVFEGLSHDLLRSLRPGDEVDLRVGERRGQEISFRTRLVGWARGDGDLVLLLRAMDSGEDVAGTDWTVFGGPLRLRVGFRSKRLLQVAFERSPLPK